jgi:hypothetical protein
MSNEYVFSKVDGAISRWENAYALTIFKNIFDNKTHRKMVFDSWDRFENLLYKLSKQSGYKPKKGEKTKGSSPLISPAVYSEDSVRRNVNVTKWARWCALDVDEYEGDFESAWNVFKPYNHICYSSASSTIEHPKFRIVFDLTENVPADKIRHFWFALNSEFKIGDTQCKDLSRMYYVPAQYPNAHNFFHSNKGEILNPNKFMEKHEFVSSFRDTFTSQIPDRIRKEMEEKRKAELTNTNIVWSSYHDCPFVNKQKVIEYRTINETGWYAAMYNMAVSIAANAIKKKYPIRPEEIATLLKQIDAENGGWYKSRPFEVECARAIDFVLNQ